MTGHELSKDILKFLGPKVVHPREWGSIVDYERQPIRTVATPVLQVDHHNGASAQLPFLRDAERKLGSAVMAEMAQMRRVDGWHYWDRGWPGGFAYRAGVGAITGRIYAARLYWRGHGAHAGDPSQLHFPVYFMIGSNDATVSDGLLEGHYLIREMLVEVFGMNKRAVTDHGGVPGNSTSCAGLLRPVTRSDAAGNPPVVSPNPVPVDPPKEVPIVSQLPSLQQTWFRSGDTTKPIVVAQLQHVRNLQSLLSANGFIAANTFNPLRQPPADGLFGPGTKTAVEAFQRAKGLQVDGKVGQFTWAKLLAV